MPDRADVQLSITRPTDRVRPARRRAILAQFAGCQPTYPRCILHDHAIEAAAQEAAAVWTKDINKALRIARKRKPRPGSVWVNGWDLGDVTPSRRLQAVRHGTRQIAAGLRDDTNPKTTDIAIR
jgi:hypothetical protein